MTRLIVDDGGQRRAFKVHDGTLTVGSGEDATLKLQADGVADIHAELEVQGGRAWLKPRPGVVPPAVGKVLATGTVEIPHATAIRIGSATLTFQYDHVPPPRKRPVELAPSSPQAKTAVQRAAAMKRVAAARREQAPASARVRRSSGPSLPGWLTVLLLLGGAALIAYVASRLLTTAPAPDSGARASLAIVREDIAVGRLGDARERLEGLPYGQLEGEVRAEYDRVRIELDAALAESELALHNMEGTGYLQSQLKNFEQNYLRGEAERPKVRVFLKRCREFERRWPKHPELDWVERMQERFGSLVSLDDPADFADIAFEVEALTWANPRDFKAALELVRGFADQTQGEGARAKALALLDELAQRRQEWFDDRLQQARFEYERGNTGKSVAWLVMLILYTGDAGMADQAAGELVKFEGLEGWLRGYRTSEPEKYAGLKQNAIVARYIREHRVEEVDG